MNVQRFEHGSLATLLLRIVKGSVLLRTLQLFGLVFGRDMSKISSKALGRKRYTALRLES